MRRFILPILALSIAAAPAALEAQTPRPERGQFQAFGRGPMNPAEQVLQHRDALGLTAEQVARLQQLQAQFTTQNQPLLAQLQAARPGLGERGERGARGQRTEEQRAQMRQRAEARLAQLTPEQRARIEQRREQMRNATPEQRQQMREEMRREMRQRVDSLTPEQRAEARRKLQAERGARGAQGRRELTAEQRAQVEALRPVMQQLRQNHDQARQQVRAVLTAEQVTRLEQLMQQRRGPARGPQGR